MRTLALVHIYLPAGFVTRRQTTLQLLETRFFTEWLCDVGPQRMRICTPKLLTRETFCMVCPKTTREPVWKIYHTKILRAADKSVLSIHITCHILFDATFFTDGQLMKTITSPWSILMDSNLSVYWRSLQYSLSSVITSRTYNYHSPITLLACPQWASVKWAE